MAVLRYLNCQFENMPNPAEAVTLSSELLKILPVVAGGILAVSGAVLSQLTIYSLNGKRDKAKLKREKLEALVQSLYEHSDWLSEKRNKLIFSTEDHDDPSPLEKAWMLQKLYFPQLRDALLALQQAALPATQYCYSQRIAQLDDRVAWQRAYDQGTFNELHRMYYEVFLITVQQAGQLASEYADG